MTGASGVDAVGPVMPAPGQGLAFEGLNVSLGSAHVLLTGGTGFVGQAILERLLADHPETTVSLLVRTKGSTSGLDRIRHLLRKPVFAAWRERVGAEGVEKALTTRIRVLEGGLDAVPDLPHDLDVVIHSASSVSFDPPIDQAFETNVGGAVGLYEALLATGTDPHVVHVSTAYVGGLRKGIFPEASLTHDVDWRAEFAAAREARSRVELASRQPEVLRRFMAEARAKHGKEGPLAVSSHAEESRIAWVKAKLVDHGRMRAESLGWTDVYTLTKAFAERAGEQLWAAAGHRLSFVRPAIVESALRHPYPGWIDGFKVADPLIMAYGRGMLPEFPGVPDSVLDVIPVDYVVNVILLVAANPAPAGSAQYFHISSGASNPLPIHRMFSNLNRFFTANPLPTPDSGSIEAAYWRFPGERKIARAVRLRTRINDARESLYIRLPSTDRTRKVLATVDQRRGDLESMRSLTDLYRHYIQSEIIFDDRKTKALQERLVATQDPAVSADIGFDMAEIEWEDYFQDVHIPAITTMTRAFSVRPPAQERAETALPKRTDVVAIFDLEGTVVDSNIVEQYLWVRGAGFGKAAWPAEVASLLACLPGYLRAEQRDRGEFIRSFLRRYEGMPVARLQDVVAKGFAQTLLRHTMSDAVERIAAHRAAGHRTILVTGSIGILVSPIADLFDEVVASRMHAENGIYTGFLDAPPLVDEARAAWLRQYAETEGFDLSASYGYGDSHADLVWLELLGNPSAVNPDANLSREALRRRWKIRDWKNGSYESASKNVNSTTGVAGATTSEGVGEG